MIPFLPLMASSFLKAHAVKIIGVGAIILVVGFACFQYKSNIKLQASNYNLQATVEQTQRRLETVLEQADKIVAINTDLTQHERKLNQRLFELTHKFTKNGRDFENLARRKPGMIAPIINKATRETMRCIETTTMGEECE